MKGLTYHNLKQGMVMWLGDCFWVVLGTTPVKDGIEFRLFYCQGNTKTEFISGLKDEVSELNPEIEGELFNVNLLMCFTSRGV